MPPSKSMFVFRPSLYISGAQLIAQETGCVYQRRKWPLTASDWCPDVESPQNEVSENYCPNLYFWAFHDREASKAVVHSIKSLQRVADTLDAKIRSEEMTIAELSFHVRLSNFCIIWQMILMLRLCRQIPLSLQRYQMPERLFVPLAIFLKNVRDNPTRKQVQYLVEFSWCSYTW